MKVKVLFFANFKELLDCASLEAELVGEPTVQNLCQQLAGKGGQWQSLFGSAAQTVKVSVNQEMANMSSQLTENDEIAFFPPVTGG